MSGLALLALLHGAFYVLSGVWPILHMRSFLAITGPKTDLWLVRAIGLLISVIGAALFTAGLRDELSIAIYLLAVGAAIGLAIVDVVYVLERVIARVYLLDAAVELLLAAAWIVLITFGH